MTQSAPLNNELLHDVQTYSDLPACLDGDLEIVANSTKYTATFRLAAKKGARKPWVQLYRALATQPHQFLFHIQSLKKMQEAQAAAPSATAKKPMIDRNATSERIRQKIEEYNTGKEMKYQIRLTMPGTMLYLGKLYVTKGAPLTDEKGWRGFKANGASIAHSLTLRSPKAFDNHIDRLAKAGFVYRHNELSGSKIRRKSGTSSHIYINPDLIVSK